MSNDKKIRKVTNTQYSCMVCLCTKEVKESLLELVKFDKTFRR